MSQAVSAALGGNQQGGLVENRQPTGERALAVREPA